MLSLIPRFYDPTGGTSSLSMAAMHATIRSSRYVTKSAMCCRIRFFSIGRFGKHRIRPADGDPG